MSQVISPALKVLLNRFIDYAGLFPPAALSLDKTIFNYQDYQKNDYAWMLRWLVLPAGSLPDVPEQLTGAISLLSESDNARAATLETKSILIADRPVYCEIAPADAPALDKIKASACFAKIRTGGLKPEAIPTSSAVASFIVACAQRRLPFKATAGLHHPIRAMHALTYEDNAPQAVMHGFINVLMAAAFAWRGDTDIEAIVNETESGAFSFEDNARWRDKTITLAELEDARLNFIHAVGSCSFDEPVSDLKDLGFLPATASIGN